MTIEVRRDGAVGWLIFNRPESANAIDAQMFVDLEEAWADLDRDPAVSVIVNTGNGKVFQAGLDVVQLARHPEALKASSRQTRDSALRLTAWHCGVTKPVIAAINGTCAGGGLHFVTDADIVIASTQAVFLDPHVSVGQVSAFETIGLLKKMPMETVARMAFTGRFERLSVERAYQVGMVSEIVEPDQLRPRAQELAEAIAEQPIEHLRSMKRSLWNAMEVP